jgi:hypothetical protein
MLIRRPTPEQLAPVEALRVQIADLQTKVREITNLPPSDDEVAARINALASDAINHGQMTTLRRELLATKFNPVTAAVALRDLTPATLAVGTMRQSLIDGLTALCGQIGEGITSAARATRLTELQRDLDRLEREEERLLAALESDAFVVRRRSNARPEILLGTT